MQSKAIILKAGKEKPLKARHPWVFSGAVAVYPEFEEGDLLPVHSHSGEMLGFGYFTRGKSLAGRMVSFNETPPLEAIRKSILNAIRLRKVLFPTDCTDSYRLINGEGDSLPGLIVDRYARAIVIQITTRGMDRLRSFIVETLIELVNPALIYEKSSIPSRKEEGLQPVEGLLYGTLSDPITIKENNHLFLIDITSGQKTGFFLDHREMRQQVGQLAKGKKVLNCFSYTGGFSVYSAAAGAQETVSVDISEEAIALAKKNMALNGYQGGKFVVADVFKFLREDALDFDLVILDPPAFAKRKKDIINACRGYKDINRVAMQKMKPGSFLLTSSCSYYVDEALFQKVIFQAAVEAGRNVRILGRHRLAADHPIHICHPEGDYLKSLLLYIE